MHSVDVEINGTGPTNSVIENLVSLNSKGIGILVEYYRNFTFKNCKILRDPGLPSWEMADSRAIQAHNLIDHMYPLETRSADRAINLVVRNFEVAVKNFNAAGNDDRGEAADMAKWQVIGAPIDHNCPKGAFNNTGTYYGIPLVTTVAKEEDLLPFPAFSPAAGTYRAAQTVTISSVPGAAIYYVIGSHNESWQSLEYKLKTGSWTRYTTPVPINQNRRLIAVAVKDGQYSRVREGYYYLDASQPPPPPPPPPPVVTQTKYEAELAQLSGTTVNNAGSGFSGTGYVNSLDNTGDKISFSVQAPVAGSYPLTIRFKNSCGACEKWQNVTINTAAPVYTHFAAATTGWQDKTYGNINLLAGTNTIAISKSWGWTDIDYIIIGNSSAATTHAHAASADDQLLTVYPNPVNGNMLTVHVHSDRNVDAQISILSSTSNKLTDLKQTLIKGNNTIQVPVGHMRNGVYMLVIHKGNERMVKQVLIRR
jgi:hypothetical protein